MTHRRKPTDKGSYEQLQRKEIQATGTTSKATNTQLRKTGHHIMQCHIYSAIFLFINEQLIQTIHCLDNSNYTNLKKNRKS